MNKNLLYKESVRIIKGKVLIILITLVLFSVIPMNRLVYADDNIIDYRKNYPAPPGVRKPTAGMKIKVEHQDGSISEQWVTANDQYNPIEAYVGDKVIVTDWSKTGSGKRLKMWDFQYYDGNEYHKELKSARQDGVIKKLTLSNVGTYEFYLCTEDDKTVGNWQNWSPNGSHRAKRKLDNGKTFYMYFVRLDINVEIAKPPQKEKYIKAFISGPSEVDEDEKFTLDSSPSISSSPIVRWTWYKKGNHKSGWDDELRIKDDISKTTTYGLEIQNEQGLTDYAEKTVVCMSGGERVDYIKCDYDVREKVKYSNGRFNKGYDARYKDDSYVEGHKDEEFKGIKTYVVSIYDSVKHEKDTSIYVTTKELKESHMSANSYIGERINDILNGWYTQPGKYNVGVYQKVYDDEGNYDSLARTIYVTKEKDDDDDNPDDPDPDKPIKYRVEIIAEDEEGNVLLSKDEKIYDEPGEISIKIPEIEEYEIAKAKVSNLDTDGNYVTEVTSIEAFEDSRFNALTSYNKDNKIYTLNTAENKEINKIIKDEKLVLKYIYKKLPPNYISVSTSPSETRINEMASIKLKTNCTNVKVYKQYSINANAVYSKINRQLITTDTFTSAIPEWVYILAAGKGHFENKKISYLVAVEPDEEEKIDTTSPLDSYSLEEIEKKIKYELLTIIPLEDKKQLQIKLNKDKIKWGSDIRKSTDYKTGEHEYSYRYMEVYFDTNYWYDYDRTKFVDDDCTEFSEVELEVEPEKQKVGEYVKLIPKLKNIRDEKYFHGKRYSNSYGVPQANEKITGKLEFTTDEEERQVAVVIAKGKFYYTEDWIAHSNTHMSLIYDSVEDRISLSEVKSRLINDWEEKIGNHDFEITILPETYTWTSGIKEGYVSSSGSYKQYSRDFTISYIIDTDYDIKNVDFVDDLELGEITVECRDSKTDIIIQKEVLNRELNTDITVNAPVINGYELDEEKSEETETVILTEEEKEKTVIFYYNKAGVPPPIGGQGQIVFKPNTSFDIPNNREGWVNKNIQVAVSIEGDKTAERSEVALRAYEYEEENEDGESKKVTGTAPCTFTETWEVGSISISGAISSTVSGMNGGNVTIYREGSNLELSARLNEWISKKKVWGSDSAPNGGNWTDNGEPSGSTVPPELYTGSSEIYKLDKNKPTSSSSIASRNWTNIPYSVTINAFDNLSGFWNSTSYLDVTDRSHYRNNQIRQNFSKAKTNESKIVNINKNGVYNIRVGLEDIAKNIMFARTYGEYRFDNVKPYEAQFDIVGCTDVVSRNIPNIGHGFQYMADYSNKIRVTIGDDLSGLEDTKFLITKTPSFPSITSMKNLNEGTDEAIAAPIRKTFHINLNCGLTKESISASKFSELKEGLWYVHIYQRDRAGNETETTSPPVFINKIKNFRTTRITDYNWKDYFVNTSSFPTTLAKSGISIKDMPIYKNKENKGIKLGYKVYYKLDTVGFDEELDSISIKPKFYSLSKNNKLTEVDLYVEDDNSGNYKLIQNSEYDSIAYNIKLDKSNRKVSESISNSKYNTWEFSFFIPPTTKAVKKGETLDLVDKNYKNYKMLITFEIIGFKSYNSTFDYTTKDDKWSKSDGKSYGSNRPTNLDLGLGVNHGQAFWYNLYESFLDDFKLYREW